MADHVVKVEAFYGGAWNEISSEVTEGSIRFSRGLTEIGEIRPASLELTLEDPTDKWRPGNPTSAVYGQAGRAMPLRLTVDTVVRGYAEADSFEPDQTEEFDEGPPVVGRKWVSLGASGILARINSWEESVQSPMDRAIGALSNLVGHWPMGDGTGATQLSNTVNGGAPGLAQLIDFGDTNSPAGAFTVIRLTEADSRIGGSFISASTTAGWQFAWSSKLPALPSSSTYLQMFSWRTSNGYRWTVDVNDTSYRFRVTDATSALLEDTAVLHSPNFGPPNEWITFRMKATESAGTVTAEFAWYVQAQDTPWGTTGTFSGTLGRLVSWSANGNAWMQEALISHVFGVTTGSDDLLSFSILRAFDGFVGETAAARVDRLLTDEGIPFVLVGTEADTMPMGRQPPLSLSGILKECASTERGLLYDSASSQAVEMRTRVNLMNQTAVNFTWPTGIVRPFRETYDSVGLANYVTASQRDGGESTVFQADGPMSVQNIPDGIGLRKGSVDVNVEDESVLPDIAGWELAHGTVEGPRFPSVIFDLDAAPSLAASVGALDIGDRITVTGFREFVIDLIILGISEAPAEKRRKVTFTCIPGNVFSEVGLYDGDARMDSKTTTLAEALTTGETIWDITTSDFDDCFSSTEEPYDVIVAGEVCTVTNCTAPAGSGPYTQTMTCTRSVNGVVKTHEIGESINVYQAARWALGT